MLPLLFIEWVLYRTSIAIWTGGDASDGGIVLYEVLFDKAGGDFSEPLAKMKAIRERCQTCRLHMEPSIPCKKSRHLSQETGNIWTVLDLQGGVVKYNDKVGSIQVTRGEGIDISLQNCIFMFRNRK